MARIAILNIGLTGHAAPAIRLGAALVRQGHEVVTWAPTPYRQQVLRSGAEFVAHEPTVGPIGGLVGFAAALAEATERCSGELIEAISQRAVELVIHDSHVPWGRVAADFLGLPRIVSQPLYPGPWPGMLKSDSLPDSLRLGVEEAIARVEACRKAIGRAWGVELGDWRTVMVSDGEAKASFTTEAVLGEIELDHSWHLLGPLMAPRASRAPERDRPLVYAAFGTFFNARKELFEAVIEALAQEPVDLVISTGRGPIPPSELQPLPPNVRVDEFVDSREVLSQASVHITHGGCSSVHESLLAGVPMVCVPQGADQSGWSARVEALGAGEIAQESAEAIKAGVTRLLRDRKAHTRAREVGESLASYDGEGRLAQLIDMMLSDS